ncbi:GxxExxY protein [Sphingopyxis indica]|uniref:GxxExxY protein n=1 Tax=Sphingopyxis indica TaxID=436663 RepID=UPI002938FCFE|nr:GxxExxY protein [Sphingopyxis indica]WOF45158.1 GxxExxY protein [Sphingopyxis indica]
MDLTQRHKGTNGSFHDVEDLARIAIDCAFHLHRDLGPGLLESVYEILLAEALREVGLNVERQLVVPITYKGAVIDNALRLDLLIEQKLVVELKSVERFAPVHGKQLLTYLRLLDLPLGLLINFGQELFRDGVKRVANNYYAPVRR